MKAVCLATLLLIASFALRTLSGQTADPTSSKRPAEQAGRNRLAARMPELRIVIYDFAHLDRSLVINASKVATDIFKESGIQTEWFECGTSIECDSHAEGVEFRLIIQPQVENLVNNSSEARDLEKSYTLGFTVPCNREDMACLSYIFYSPIGSLANQSGAHSASVLGQVMVHEIGHALLGPDAHSRTGVMRPQFSIQGMDRFLYFSSRESKRARAQLSIRDELVKKRLAEEAKATRTRLLPITK